MKKVGIQGLEGSFSEQAAKFYCNKFDIQDFELAYLISSMNVLNGLNNNEVDVGIFAMENAQGGVVIESVEALAENNCRILDMFYVEISQNLMAKDNVSLDYNEPIYFNEYYNEERTPVYHNLFVRYEYRKVYKLYNFITYVELWNAYNRKNIENYTWSTTNNSIIETTYFSFIPVGGFEVEF